MTVPLCKVSHHGTSVKVQNGWRGTELLCMHLVHGRCARCMAFPMAGVMALVVDPGSPSSSGAVIRKQLVVGCILLLLNLLAGQVMLALV